MSKVDSNAHQLTHLGYVGSENTIKNMNKIIFVYYLEKKYDEIKYN